MEILVDNTLKKHPHCYLCFDLITPFNLGEVSISKDFTVHQACFLLYSKSLLTPCDVCFKTMTPFDPDEALFIKANHVQCLNHSEHQSCMYCGHVLTTYDTQSIIINRYGAYHEECSESKKSLTYEDHRKSSLL
jgi:hypothetical protein